MKYLSRPLPSPSPPLISRFAQCGSSKEGGMWAEASTGQSKPESWDSRMWAPPLCAE